VLSNHIANQQIHAGYGGVVPELASRAHLQNIVPVIDCALKTAGINVNNLSAIAFTRGPGLLGSLLVGVSFAKTMALALNVPLIEVNHMQAHVLAHFIKKPGEIKTFPRFPFICLTVSGGHTQLVLVKNYLDMNIVGETIDDAAGEAFDKAAKLLDLPYPGGPLIDKLAATGNKYAFKFSKPNIPGLNYSFSGLKTSILYFLRDQTTSDSNFIEKNKADLCASIQHTIVEILTDKLLLAIKKYKVKDVAIAGGVSANSYLRNYLSELSAANDINLFVPPIEYCTDNAAMIAIAGYYKFLNNEFCLQDVSPVAGLSF
jgi:N6-L-threonylcarbamoyladenine synthase